MLLRIADYLPPPLLAESRIAAVGFGLFGALPPAVLNFMFAERYGQEPDKVASMVLIGNLAAIISATRAGALTGAPSRLVEFSQIRRAGRPAAG